MISTPNRRMDISSLLVRPALYLAMLIILMNAGLSLKSAARSSDLRDLAASIEGGERIDPVYLVDFAHSRRDYVSHVTCSDASTRAVNTVLLAAIEVITSTGGTNAHGMTKIGLDALVARLMCNPLDGNAWAGFAALNSAMVGLTDKALQALKLSGWTTPNEGWVLSARLGLETKLYLNGASGYEDQYSADLRRFVTYGAPKQVATTFVDMPSDVQALMKPLIESQSVDRKKMMLAEVDRLGVIFATAGMK